MTSDELLDRLTKFAKRNQQLINILPKTVYNIEYGEQLIGSSSSPGSNYIEALEATSPKDFCYRLKICRKETRESKYWLTLIQGSNRELPHIIEQTQLLITEANELIRIFTSSIITSEKNQEINKLKNKRTNEKWKMEPGK